MWPKFCEQKILLLTSYKQLEFRNCFTSEQEYKITSKSLGLNYYLKFSIIERLPKFQEIYF